MPLFTDEDLKLMAIQAIKNYLNNPRFTNETIEADYKFAINLLVSNSRQALERDFGISSMTKGAKSISYETAAKAFTINEDVKMLLPRPYIGLC